MRAPAGLQSVADWDERRPVARVAVAEVGQQFALCPDMGRFRPYSSRLNGMRVIGHCRIPRRDGRIVDIYLNDTISELALRRSEYRSTLKRQGFDVLVSALGRKIANLQKSAGVTIPAAIPH